MTRRILFVCTGNTCRSPMAEGLLKVMAGKAGLAVDVRSAGVSAVNGSPVSRHAQELLREQGASGEGRSSVLSQELIERADLILTMTGGHKRALIGQYPLAVDKTFTLKEYAEDDPQVEARVKEREQLLADLQIKQALGQTVTPVERARLQELERMMPDYDIPDPFGGSKEEYRRCAGEIEAYLHKLIRKLRRPG